MSTTPPPVPAPETSTPTYQQLEDFHSSYTLRYSISSIMQQLLILLVYSGIVTCAAYLIGELAFARSESGLLNQEALSKISTSSNYSFALSIITLSTFLLIDIRFRRGINNLQYFLIACAIACFFLLDLSFSELLPFNASYLISTAMTLVLLSVYAQSMMQTFRGATTVAVVMACEYGILLGLLHIGSFALLAGSLILFTIIALAMYFTQRMRIVDGELFLKGVPDNQ